MIRFSGAFRKKIPNCNSTSVSWKIGEQKPTYHWESCWDKLTPRRTEWLRSLPCTVTISTSLLNKDIYGHQTQHNTEVNQYFLPSLSGLHLQLFQGGTHQNHITLRSFLLFFACHTEKLHTSFLTSTNLPKELCNVCDRKKVSTSPKAMPVNPWNKVRSITKIKGPS